MKKIDMDYKYIFYKEDKFIFNGKRLFRNIIKFEKINYIITSYARI
jgi:hypothetical protein